MMMIRRKPTKGEAISQLVGGQLTIQSDGGNPVFHDGQTPPTEEAVNTKLTSMISDWDAQEYARNRILEYPSSEELTIALYDTDDKAALETKRAAVKTKWPKDNSGPV